MVDFILGLGLALPIASSASISVVTGVAQGVAEHRRQSEDVSSKARMLKFHLDVEFEDAIQQDAAGHMVVLRDGKLYIEDKDASTGLPTEATQHPFTGFYLEYPDKARPWTRGLVSTISRIPPVLNWVFVDRVTNEVKYANRTGSISHLVGDFDWTSDIGEDSALTFDGWEGFVGVQRGTECVLCFDVRDDGLSWAPKEHVRELRLIRRLVPEQELNRWGFQEDGNIGFRATREVDKISRSKV